jgi:cytoskeleton protein RodZ
MESIPERRDSQPTTAGAWLRSARQQRGLHIAALAVMLKVPQSKLEALEADRFDDLPDATFARALATAICRALKVDPGPVLALLPRTTAGDFDMSPGLNQPFRERGGPVDGGLAAVVARPVVWGPALLLLAAAALYVMPSSWLPERDTATPPAAAAGIVTTAAGPAVDYVPAPAAPASEAAAQASAPLPAAQPASAAPPAASGVSPAASAVPQPAPPAPAGQGLRITATADSWVEVVDAQGQVLLSRVLRAGEHQDYAGAPPYRVRVGNVAGTRIEWRGAAVDLAARASNNVARLELN